MLSIRFILSILLVFYFNLSFGQVVNFTSSNLPIVVINTNGYGIYDEPKTNARMGIIWNESGGVNSISDPYNNYNGNIAIEIRGSSSQMFPKKSYGFETRDANWADMNASLLGMPEEEDWILYAPYSDKTLIRNVLTFTLDASLGHYSPRCRYVELVINGQYQGLYVLMEKIKRNKNRVDIAKLKTSDVSGEDLTGGYIIKIDKVEGSGGEGFYSAFNNFNGSNSLYQYEYPKIQDIQQAQKTYIQDYIYSFEKSIYDKDYSSATGYRYYIDINSFIDYMIIYEMAKNVDAYRLSTFFFKDKNGKLNIGPIWDFDLAYGNANYYNQWLETGLQVDATLGSDIWQIPFWWSGLRKDPFFNKRIVERWDSLRTRELSTDRIFFVMDSLTTLISDARIRNFQRWNIINQWVWPNYFVGPSYDSEVIWMKSWVINRLHWLDLTFTDSFVGEASDTMVLFYGEKVEVGPNPFYNKLTFFITSEFKFPVTLNVYNLTGVLVSSETVNLERGPNEYDYPNVSKLIPGIYFYKIEKADRILQIGKIVKAKN